MVTEVLPVQAQSDSAPTARSTLRALVIDDDDMVRELTCDMLSVMGYETLDANSGEAALALPLHDTDVHLVISDIVMPGINGPEAVERLRQQIGWRPVVLMSGYTNRISTNKLMRRDCAFLPKPFTTQELQHAVHQALSMPPAS